ncbi:tRNA (cytosine-5-)-methyltransferase, partial [Dimargaris xerosporica]
MQLRIAEFYSGIGGMHYAWLEAGLNGEFVASFDINTFANEVNQFNFADATIHHRSIESQSLKFYQKLHADVYLMSPPCQPYTRIGLQRGSDDTRAKSFLFLLEIISKLGECRPRYLLIENVVGFENSDTHTRTLECLKACAYDVEEFIINPNQLGVPNSRSRYYLL